MQFFMVASIVSLLAGLWLYFDFWSWFFKGRIVQAKIEGFEKHKPVVSFETKDGETLKARVERITHMGYLLGQPKEGDIFNAIYIDGEPVRVRLYGYLYLLAGTLMLFPPVLYVAMTFQRTWMMSQVSFMIAFAALVTGSWMFLKWVRGNY